jgi:hypothetical protein
MTSLFRGTRTAKVSRCSKLSAYRWNKLGIIVVQADREVPYHARSPEHHSHQHLYGRVFLLLMVAHCIELGKSVLVSVPEVTCSYIVAKHEGVVRYSLY